MKGKLVYLRRPNTGSGSRSSTLMYWDLEEREEKSIISDVNEVKLTADGEDDDGEHQREIWDHQAGRESKG